MTYGIPEPGSYFRVPEDDDTSRDNALEFVAELAESEPLKLASLADDYASDSGVRVEAADDMVYVWANQLRHTHLELDCLNREDVVSVIREAIGRSVEV